MPLNTDGPPDHTPDFQHHSESATCRSSLCTRRGWADFHMEAQILQCVEQDAGDLLPVCDLLCCSLLGSSISSRDASRINTLIRKAGTVIGLKLETFESVMSKRSLNKLLSIMDDPSHPLHETLQGQRRLIQLRCHKGSRSLSSVHHQTL